MSEQVFQTRAPYQHENPLDNALWFAQNRGMKKLISLTHLFQRIKETVLRFPGEVVCALLVTGWVIRTVESEVDISQEHVLFTLALGLPLFLAMTLWREANGFRQRKHLLFELILGAGLLLAHFALTQRDQTSSYALRYLQTSFALHMLVAFVPFLQDGRGFWQFNKLIFLRILLSGLFASVFFVGITIAMVTVAALFSVKIPSGRYGELLAVSFLTLQTLHFLAGVPGPAEWSAPDLKYPRGLRVFVQFLLIPLTSLYMLILYCYMARIGFLVDWPKGYVAWLVSVMSVLGMFNLLLLDPEKGRVGGEWIRVYAQGFYLLILPLLLMLFISIGKRIHEYGITEQRYFLVALGVLLAGLSIYFIFSRRKNIKVVPISLFVVASLSLAGPWSAYSISEHDQVQRARQILEKNGLLRDGRIQPALEGGLKISEADRRQLGSIFQYLSEAHGEGPLSAWFNKEQVPALDSLHLAPSRQSSYDVAEQAMKVLGMAYLDQNYRTPEVAFSLTSDLSKAVTPVSGFHGWALLSVNGNAQRIRVGDEDWVIRREAAMGRVAIERPSGKTAYLDLMPVVKAEVAKHANIDGELKFEPGSLFIDSIGVKPGVRLLIESFNLRKSNDEISVVSVNGYLLFR